MTRVFEAGGPATGRCLVFEPGSKPYAEFRTDETALGHYHANTLALGRALTRRAEPPG
ncbi:hypothetical protein [Streptomyces sp. NPDC057381]|uniref:hypothetical protein n=1 Tax=unclassified Streptomyces TaxID=2593676 RepID=UPI00362F3C6D